MADGAILLGLVDEIMSENDDKICGWTTNKIGGTPNWLLGPPRQYPTCRLCNRVLYLVCQVYCPLSDSIFHRVLYIFGCTNQSCWNKNTSWKVLRSQAKDSNFGTKKTTNNEPSSEFIGDDWCDDAEDWGDEDDDVLTHLEQCAGNLKIAEDNLWKKDLETDANTTTCTMQQQSANLESLSSSQLCNTFSPRCIPHFTPFYVSVIEDPEAKMGATQLTKHEKKLLSEYEQREGIHVAKMMDNHENPKEWAGETYERTAVKHGDRAFHKFNKKLQLCPQQCLRYQWNGAPASTVTENVSKLLANVPRCQHCAAERVFELQFMPALIGNLKGAKQLNLAHKPDSPHHENQEGQISQESNQTKLETLENSEIFPDDPTYQQDQWKTFMAAVNQTGDVTIEFGTVMVFTCSQGCWKNVENNEDSRYLEEFCLVECDPDDRLFKYK